MRKEDGPERADAPAPAGGTEAEPGDGRERLLRVEAHRRGDAVRLVLAGELDLATAPAVRRELRGLLRGSPTRLLVDLRELSFMDSTGIRLLLELSRGAESDGYELAVVKGPPVVHRVLELTGVEDRLPIVASPDGLAEAI